MSAQPDPDPNFFRLHDHVKVTRNGTYHGMTGEVIQILNRRDGGVIVQFAGYDQRFFQARDLEPCPRAAAKIPMV